MKLHPVKRDAKTRYPSIADYRKNRPSALRHLALGAGLLAAGSASAFAGENAEAQRIDGDMPVPVEVHILGDMIQPLAPREQKPAKPAEVKPAEPLTAEQTEQLEALVVQLGDNNFQTREAAQRKIEAMGAGAAGPLEKYKEHEDAEVRMRVGAILAKMQPAPAEEQLPIIHMMGLMPMPAEVDRVEKPAQDAPLRQGGEENRGVEGVRRIDPDAVKRENALPDEAPKR